MLTFILIVIVIGQGFQQSILAVIKLTFFQAVILIQIIPDYPPGVSRFGIYRILFYHRTIRSIEILFP